MASWKAKGDIDLPNRELLWAAIDVKDAARVIVEVGLSGFSGCKSINLSYESVYSINRLLDICTLLTNAKSPENFKNYTICHPEIEFDLADLREMGIKLIDSFENALGRFLES